MVDFTGEILNIIDEARNVKTFRIKSPDNFTFIAGQHCIVSLPDSEKEEVRPFTFSNSPAEKGHIDLTVKKVGSFTKRLFSFKKGDKINIKGPLGKTFNFDENTKDELVFLSGGSGITPFLSIIRYIEEKGLKNKIILFNGNLTEEDIICSKDMDNFNSKENIKVINVITNPKDQVTTTCSLETGFITKDIVEKYVTEPENKVWFVCGPPPMVSAMEILLSELNIPSDRIRLDKWEIKK
ncbi:MAG: FAD-dependent oxidoreductase [Candidatus Woesearchaeota archaeon]